MGALSKLDEFLLNPQIRTFSGTTPGTFRNTDVENQEPSGNCSQNDPHPEVEFFACRASNLTDSDPEETYHTRISEFCFEKMSESISKKSSAGVKLESLWYACLRIARFRYLSAKIKVF